jgi:DNA gyrase subunit A
MEADKFIAQTRGGKGSTIKLENSDYIIETIYGVNEDSIQLLSNIGKAYSLKLGSLPIGDGVYLQTLLEMGVTERITHVIPYNKIDQYKYVIIATKNGMIKKTSIEEYKGKRKAGLVGIKLKDDSDAVAAVGLIQNEDDELFIVTKESACLRIKQEDVNATGRATMGVKAIKLDANDSIIGMEVLSQNRKYLGLASVSKNGIAKCKPIDEFSISSRYTKGTTLQNLREGDTQAAIKLILDNKSDIFVIASNAIIRIPLGELKISGRNTIGTTTMKLRESQQILKLAQAEE